jgi:hypothetical protein
MSTLETTIVISAVMLVLSALIILPAQLCAEALTDAQDAIEDVLSEDDLISPERLNTFFTGISENYRIIYGSIVGEVSDEEE